MTKPITPDEIAEAKEAYLPPEVIEVFNDLIAKNWSGMSAKFLQEDAVSEITVRMGCHRTEVFRNKWLDVEDVYRASGWAVTYDKPGWNENYAATFEFRRKS